MRVCAVGAVTGGAGWTGIGVREVVVGQERSATKWGCSRSTFELGLTVGPFSRTYVLSAANQVGLD